MSHEMTPAEVAKHVRTYVVVFIALAALTVITVAVSYVHLSIFWAVVIAMIVASVKGTLVAAFFMHLISERVAIYATLVLSAIFFIMLMMIPVFAHSGNVVVNGP
jgi:cytochrome c oxidase subunit 4